MSKHDEIVKVLENKIFGFDDRAIAVMVRRDDLPYLATAIEQLSNSGDVIAEGRLMAFNEEEMCLEYKKGCIHFYNNKDLYRLKGKRGKLVFIEDKW